VRTTAALALVLLAGCYRVHTLTPLEPAAARAALSRPHDDTFTVGGVRIAPDSQLVVRHGAATTRVRAGALDVSALALTPPGGAPIPWSAVDQIAVRRTDGTRTLLLLLASAGIVYGCAWYDCFSRVPR